MEIIIKSAPKEFWDIKEKAKKQLNTINNNNKQHLIVCLHQYKNHQTIIYSNDGKTKIKKT